jgi:hypothetical protein
MDRIASFVYNVLSMLSARLRVKLDAAVSLDTGVHKYVI